MNKIEAAKNKEAVGIQMDEKEWKNFYADYIDEAISINNFLTEVKNRGWLIKSPLRQKIEEAEEMWDGYQNRRTQFVPENYNQMIEHQHETIQLLKADHPELKGVGV